MAKYLVTHTHTSEQCLKSLDEIVAHNPNLLSATYLGCKTGDHSSWAVLDGKDENDIRNQLPSIFRNEATVVAVSKLTPEEVRSYHQQPQQPSAK